MMTSSAHERHAHVRGLATSDQPGLRQGIVSAEYALFWRCMCLYYRAIEATLLLRSIATSGDWEAYGEAHMHQERRRLYGNIFDAVGITEAYDEPPQKKIVGM